MVDASYPWPAMASGGTITEYIDASNQRWKVHTFASQADNIFRPFVDMPVQYLVVGGGGGGGNDIKGGGGGAGGQVLGGNSTFSFNAINSVPYTITLGLGGKGADASVYTSNGASGGNSSIVGGSGANAVNIIAIGGGGGGSGKVATVTNGGGQSAGSTATPFNNFAANGVIKSGGARTANVHGGGGGSTASAGLANGNGGEPTEIMGFHSDARIPYGVGGGGGTSRDGCDGGYSAQTGSDGACSVVGSTRTVGGTGLPTLGWGGGGGIGARRAGYGSSGIVILRYKADIQAQALGGDEVRITGAGTTKYGVHIFRTPATFTPKSNTSVEYLVVGGGGSGGFDNTSYLGYNRGGGGGGGGGVLTGTTTIPVTGATITIGAGGAGTSTNDSNNGSPSILTVGSRQIAEAIGGGGGGVISGAATGGKQGASGGGAGFSYGMQGTPPGRGSQGNWGGTNLATTGREGSGGGGGASAAGVQGGDGGAGLTNNYTGESVVYGSGGGGYKLSGASVGGTNAGRWSNFVASLGVTSGTPNTGSGGGGASSQYSTTSGGSGGSGIVVIRYEIKDPALVAAETALKEFYVSTFLPLKPMGAYLISTVKTAVDKARMYVSDVGDVAKSLKTLPLATWTSLKTEMDVATKSLTLASVDTFATTLSDWRDKGLNLADATKIKAQAPTLTDAEIARVNAITSAVSIQDRNIVSAAATIAAFTETRTRYNQLWEILLRILFAFVRSEIVGADTNPALDLTRIDECFTDTSLTFNYGRQNRTADQLSEGFPAGGGTPGNIRSIVRAGDSIFVGGSFSTTDGNKITVNKIFRIQSGIPPIISTLSTPPANSIIGTNDNVQVILPVGNDIYVGGTFTTAGGSTMCQGIARWNAATGWSPLGRGTTPTQVFTMAVIGDNLYVGGFINTVSQTDGTSITVNHIARWNITESKWYALAVVNPGITPSSNSTSVSTLVANGTDLYIGGSFTKMNDVPAAYIARYDTLQQKTYALSGFSINFSVGSLDIQGSILYIAGAFVGYNVPNTANQIPSKYLMMYDMITETPTPLGPSSAPNAGINIISVQGKDIYVGGQFTQIGTNTSIKYIAKLDPVTNTLTMLPKLSLSGTQVMSLLVDCFGIYIGTNTSLWRYYDKTYVGSATSYTQILDLFYADESVKSLMSIFYGTLYLPALRYLSAINGDVTANITSAVSLCTTYYYNADGTVKSSGYVKPPGDVNTTLSTLRNGIIDFVQKMLDRYRAAYQTWVTQRGMSTTAPAMAAQTIDISNYSTVFSSLSTNWSTLMTSIRNFVKNDRIVTTLSLRTWYTTARSSNVTVNGVSVPGMGQSLS